MRRNWLLGGVAALSLLTAGVLVLSGCGGSGGPVSTPETGPAPSVSAQFIRILPAAQTNANYVGSDKCLTCHNDNYHAGWKNTKHGQVGAGCEQCHGPGGVHVANRSATPAVVTADILSMNNGSNGSLVDDPVVCGQCHGPTYTQYLNSRHSGVVEDVIAAAHANPLGEATCLRCHSNAVKTKFINGPWTQGLLAGTPVPTIQNAADTALSALTPDQITSLVNVTHNSANCVTCHDPHTKTGKLTSAGEDFHLRRATFSTDVTPVLPGSPAKVNTNFDHICGTCHNTRGGKPDDVTIMTAAATARPPVHEGPEFNMLNGIGGSLPTGTVVQTSSHQQVPDQCVHCHMPTARHTFTVSLDTSCSPCHTPTDAAAREASVRGEVLNDLLSLRTRMENWAKAHFATAPAGWTGSTSDLWNYYTLASADPDQQNISKGIQSQIPIEIRRARLNYYFIILDRSFGVHNTPYVRQLIDFSQSQLDALGISRSVPVPSRAAGANIIKQDVQRAILSEMMDGGYGMRM
jgi:hypothetical protein